MLENFFLPLFPSDDSRILTLMIFTFFVAGLIKGFLGIGLPAVGVGVLTLVLSPTHAMSLLVIPIIFTNLSQFVRCKYPVESIKKYWVLALTILISIFITSVFLSKYPVGFLTISIGVAMIFVSLNGLFGFRMRTGPSPCWQVGFGLLSGVLGGLSAIWSPPITMYLISRGINKDQFISATGFLFLVGSFPLAIGLFLGGILNQKIIFQSIFGLVIVLFGFYVGEGLGRSISQKRFEMAVYFAFFCMGLRLIAVGLF